jgi:hypothetical protein
VRISYRALITAIAIGFGLVVLLGYFGLLGGEITSNFLRWAAVLAAVTLWVGVVNLASVHWRKVTSRQNGWFFSLVLILSLIATVAVVALNGPTGSLSMFIFNYIQIPIETSLFGILAVVLAYAAARLLRRQVSVFSLIFIGTVLLVLVGTASLPFIDLPVLRQARDFLAQVGAAGGARGILLGVALGTLATGLRVLMGADRPYGG